MAKNYSILAHKLAAGAGEAIVELVVKKVRPYTAGRKVPRPLSYRSMSDKNIVVHCSALQYYKLSIHEHACMLAGIEL